MTRSKQERDSTIDSGIGEKHGSVHPEKVATPLVDGVEIQAGAACPAVLDQNATIEGAAVGLREEIERMHERDRERVAGGEINAQDLHFIPAEMARTSVVVWTEAAVRRFRR